MARCVDGHETQAEDFCDQCGMPVVATDPEPEPGPEATACPNCGAPRQNHSLFCESCGYDYTTGALPQQDLRAELGLPPAKAATPAADHDGQHDSENPGTDGEKDLASAETPQAEEIPSTGVEAPQEEEAPSTADSPESGGSLDAGPSEGPAKPAPATTGAPAAAKHVPWVAEVWIDPQWYASQESTDPLPPQGPPRIVPLKESALIGRHSTSRNIHPDVDCEPDVGCSRRQAYLTFADGYWYINDLDSANGTFVAPATAALPEEPITTRTQIGPDTRVYVGAWTRIVVRPAIKEELQA